MGSISEDSLLKARIKDAAELCERRDIPCFLGFLDERQRAAAEGMLRSHRQIAHRFFGGHPEAERTLLGLFPPYMEESDDAVFPLTAVGFSFRGALTHRDFLGAILACEIKREKIGDILCGDGIAVVFADEKIAPFLAEQLEKVGNVGVTVQLPYDGALPAAHTFRDIRDTVASPRLDALVRVCIGASREEAARRIVAGLVARNHQPCLSASAEVREGDVLSIRGEGRFRVETLGPLTRKGRLNILVKKYV